MKLFLFLFIFFLSGSSTFSFAANVTYDRRSLIIDGQRKLLISASIHYPRSVPEMWPGLVQAAKEGGADVIESYVFWNGHEPSPGNYYFGGRFNLVKFVKTIQDAGMYMILRIGPFVAAEYHFGGVPVWLHYIPGTEFRTDNMQYKYHMQKFMTLIVNLMKKEKLFASQGGPIILAQVENEYGWYESVYGEPGKRYAMWAMQMALSQNIGVPWVMCQQYDAPESVIDTCNSFYCDDFAPVSPNITSPNKPKIWTENWPGWFSSFGSAVPRRPAEDIAFSVARFFQKGGSVQNYYMYHGGTNFGRTGGDYLTTSYDYDAPIDEYGLPRYPKWGHLKELHSAIKLCEHALLNNHPINLKLGPSQEADVYANPSGECVAFLSNKDNKTDKIVKFRNKSYHLPAWSVSILPHCKNVVYNTAKVSSQQAVVEMVPEELPPLKWETYKEKAGIWGDDVDFVANGLVDHLNTTMHTTDYLWYTISINVTKDEKFLKNGSSPILVVQSKGHALHVFVNDEIQGTTFGNFSQPIPLKAGKNEIALLSMTIGLRSAGLYYEWTGAGLTSVKIKGFNNGTWDLSSQTWSYKKGLEGELLKLHQPQCLNVINWVSTSEPPKNQSLTWYKTVVDQPAGDEPIGLDMLAMGKGQAWLNGEEIGRYWPVNISNDGQCVEECDYRGTFFQKKCLSGCGGPTQRWYHIPRSWFKPTGNILVIFEEKGGDPTKIRFSRRKILGACAVVAEDFPLATMNLKCPKNQFISAIKFASFGTPTGKCGSYSTGDCHDPNTSTMVEKACLKKNECSIKLAGGQHFDASSCSLTTKRKLAVEVVCS